MKQLRTIVPGICLCLALISATSFARADNTGKLQFMFTAYLDVPALFPGTLASCVTFDPSTGPELQRLYSLWYEAHGRHQGELQQLLHAYWSKEMGEARAQAFIADIKIRVQTQLAPLHFPQNHTWTDNWFCTRLLPKDLRGKDLMLNFAWYVEELKKGVASP
ncbi:hypothetical protein DBR37_02435 [Herminiimonas sp. KBW02]|uniref:hypothetical protein n=1 Tax=Herminiimonas sp. KBW02 TaxID=2153363 RepID=UPI000F5B7238|nr:hypothetical protein [Herminiimonas sp. KBW02]RQO37072.1 hypothetical protein DBR37_02435 [Herminiimonas sp. KBW02]